MMLALIIAMDIAALVCAAAGVLSDDVQKSILFWVLFLVNIHNADRLERYL